MTTQRKFLLLPAVADMRKRLWTALRRGLPRPLSAAAPVDFSAAIRRVEEEVYNV